MSVVSEAAKLLGAKCDEPLRWAARQRTFEAAWHSLDAYFPWLLVEVGYDFDAVLQPLLDFAPDWLRAKFDIELRYPHNSTLAYNIALLWCQHTGIDDSVLGDMYRQRYSYDNVYEKLTARVLEALRLAEPDSQLA